MSWYNPFSWGNAEKAVVEEKLNPGQPAIAMDEGNNVTSTERVYDYITLYEQIELVNRAINMVVDDAAEIKYKVGDKYTEELSSPVKSIRKVTLDRLLNKQPNIYQDRYTFMRNILLDVMLDGNAFIYWDGRYMYQLPAEKIDIVPSKKTHIEKYVYREANLEYFPSEIIHIKENSFRSTYRGISRLKPAFRTMCLLSEMRKFQDNFFKNGAVVGLVIKTPNTLSEKVKERTLAYWKQRYNPAAGGRSPLILDGGTEVEQLTDVDFQKIGFEESIASNEKIILKALGIPPVLMDSGNNANIRPNHRLYYLETILPLVEKVLGAYSRFFGWELEADTIGIPALQPELKEQASYYTTLVNGGLMTPNEGREGLGLETIEDDDMETIRIPQNIAGSATDPSQGGRPPEDEE